MFFALVSFPIDLITLWKRKNLGKVVNSSIVFYVHYLIIFVTAACALTAAKLSSMEHLSLLFIMIFIYFVGRALFPSYLLRSL
jgi:hypothetical protein